MTTSDLLEELQDSATKEFDSGSFGYDSMLNEGWRKYGTDPEGAIDDMPVNESEVEVDGRGTKQYIEVRGNKTFDIGPSTTHHSED